jgi:hypothetical protein
MAQALAPVESRLEQRVRTGHLLKKLETVSDSVMIVCRQLATASKHDGEERLRGIVERAEELFDQRFDRFLLDVEAANTEASHADVVAELTELLAAFPNFRDVSVTLALAVEHVYEDRPTRLRVAAACRKIMRGQDDLSTGIIGRILAALNDSELLKQLTNVLEARENLGKAKALLNVLQQRAASAKAEAV